MPSEPPEIGNSKASASRSGAWDLPLFLCQVTLIVIGTGILMAGATSLPLTLAKTSSGFAAMLRSYDPNGLSVAVLGILPVFLGWWLYTKSLRRIASRLGLGIPRKYLGIPLLGELLFVAELMRHGSRRW